MSMYGITRGLDGRFYCACRIQDGVERWVERTLKEAKRSVKRAAKILNGMQIKKRDIELFKEIRVDAPPPTMVVEWDGE